MNPAMLNDRLSRLIGDFAAAAMQSRQVARRLTDLLPSRFRELRREHARHAKGSNADRLTLTDARYAEAIDQLCDVSGQATLNRIQYETHTMLFKARQSLRRYRR